MANKELLDKLTQTIVDGDEDTAAKISKETLAAGIDSLEAIQEAAKGLDIIGERYQKFEAFLPELILAGDAMKVCTDILLPHVKKGSENQASLGKVVIGTVAGDIHDIGKNLVAGMLSIAGFEVHDLGSDVPVKRFIEKAEEIKATVIALSALMSTSAPFQEELIKYLVDSGQRSKFYVVVGGGPITPEWAIRMGADGHARLAINVGELLQKIVTGRQPPPLTKTLIAGY